MDQEVINKIFKLVDLVSEAPVRSNTSKHKKNDLIGIPEIMMLDNIEGIKESRTDFEGNNIEVYKEINNKFIGFNEENFRLFRKVINQVIGLEPYLKFSSVEFIEKHLLDWILETHSLKKALMEPLTYLLEKFNEELNTYTFYFSLKAVGISKPFVVGNTEFTFFTKEFLDVEFEKFLKTGKDKTRKDFDALFKGFLNTPIAKVSAKGTLEKAKFIAKEDAAISISAIKCFLQKESMDINVKIFDVDFQFSEIQPNLLLYESSSGDFDFCLNMELNDGVVPMHLDAHRMYELFSAGLKQLSDYLKIKKDTEFALLLFSMINQIGSFISIRNLHERCVRIVALYEYLFLSSTKGQGKGLTVINKSILPKIVSPKELDSFRQFFISLYDIRDKYLHNGIKKSLDTKEIFYIQIITVRLLLYLVKLSGSLSTKNELLDYFNIKKRF